VGIPAPPIPEELVVLAGVPQPPYHGAAGVGHKLGERQVGLGGL
jgi:hypothetical protein